MISPLVLFYAVLSLLYPNYDLRLIPKPSSPTNPRNIATNEWLISGINQMLYPDPNSTSNPTSIKPLVLRNMTFVDQVNFYFESFPVPITFSNCHFTEGIIISDCNLHSVSFSNCLIESVSDEYDSPALSIQDCIVSKNIVINDHTALTGCLSIIDSTVGGDVSALSCYILLDNSDNDVDLPVKRSVSINGTDVHRSVILSRPFLANGQISIQRSTILRDLYLNHAQAIHPLHGDISLANLEIGGTLSVVGIAALRTFEILNVNCSKLHDTQINEHGLYVHEPIARQHIRKSFHFDDFQSESITNANYRINWLRLNSPRYFDADMYKLIADMYLAAENKADYERVMIAMNSDANSTNANPIARAWNWTYGNFAGYGYQPEKLVVPAFILWTIGFVVFGINFKRMIPIENLHGQSRSRPQFTKQVNPKDYLYILLDHIMNTIQWLTFLFLSKIPFARHSRYLHRYKAETREWHDSLALPINYPDFRPFLFSADLSIPILNLRQSKYWFPSSDSSTVRLYAYFHIVIGWALTTMLAFAIVEIVQR